MKILVTGGAGFIGSAFVRLVINSTSDSIVVVDKLTYAGNLESLAPVTSSSRYHFERVDICDHHSLRSVFNDQAPDAVVHLAAESHVDRSIDGPADFINTNIVGTYALLETVRDYLLRIDARKRAQFRFHHVSTDEVFGDLGADSARFEENTPYAPSSPYSASKAAADHLVRAWHRTYGLPILLTNCSNNYGPYQFPEKLIPLMILNALDGKSLPVYGSGLQIRDWLYVEDHARALYTVLTRGVIGETYNIGGNSPIKNIDVVEAICELLEVLVPEKPDGVMNYRNLIEHVTDRPGHDLRYEINSDKIQSILGWRPMETFESGLRKTVSWFLANRDWCSNALSGSYERQRLGLVSTDKAGAAS